MEGEARPLTVPGGWFTRHARLLALLGLAGVFAAVVLRKAWVCDDAYITFRVVDNLFHGHGLTWNPGERVQVFTHPLWMLLVAGLHGVTREFYFTSLILGATLSVAAVVLLARGLGAPFRSTCLALAMLIVSAAFTDYSTSGLENPLVHVLLAAFLCTYSRLDVRGAGTRRLFFLAGLSALTRFDAAFLLLPPLGYVAARQRGRTTVVAAAMGLAPLVAWGCFALVYYGVPLPNPAYAKLGGGLPAAELAGQGVRYLTNSLRLDPVTLAVIATGTVLPFLRRQRAWMAVSAGIVLHLAYVVRIGGDFMSGRFLTAPLLVAASALAALGASRKLVWPGFAVVMVLSLVRPYSPFRAGRDYGPAPDAAIDRHGIADERTFYTEVSALRRAPGQSPWPGPKAAALAAMLRSSWKADAILDALKQMQVVSPEERWPPPAGQAGGLARPVAVRTAVGLLGYYAGPGMHLVDVHGITDPLLARLPAVVPDPIMATISPHAQAKPWRIGHFVRRLPEGYLETLGTGRNSIRDPDLAGYYDRLATLTRGRLLERRRLGIVVAMNLGRYDALRERYVQRSGSR